MKNISHEYASNGTELIYRGSKKKMTVAVWKGVEAHQFDREASKQAWELFYRPIFGLTTNPAMVATSTEKPDKVLDVYEARTEWVLGWRDLYAYKPASPAIIPLSDGTKQHLDVFFKYCNKARSGGRSKGAKEDGGKPKDSLEALWNILYREIQSTIT